MIILFELDWSFSIGLTWTQRRGDTKCSQKKKRFKKDKNELDDANCLKCILFFNVSKA